MADYSNVGQSPEQQVDEQQTFTAKEVDEIKKGYEREIQKAKEEIEDLKSKWQGEKEELVQEKRDLRSHITTLQSDLDDQKNSAATLEQKLEKERSGAEALRKDIEALQGGKETEPTSEQSNSLTQTIVFQMVAFIGTTPDPQVVEKIVDLVSRTVVVPDSNTSTSTPSMSYIKPSPHQPTFVSTPYNFWIAVQYGTLTDVLRSGQSILDSRSISTTTAAQIFWLEDALPLLVNRIQTPSPENTRVHLFVLQAVAQLHELSPESNLGNLLDTIGQYIESLDDGFIVRSVHGQVSDFIHQGNPITIWRPAVGDDDSRTLDHTNSDLSQGLQLTADRSGILMLSQETSERISTYVLVLADVDTWVKSVSRPTIRWSRGWGVCRVGLCDASQLRLSGRGGCNLGWRGLD
ncbi:MAG: hypothetical protein LQ350_004863 [Teloschistes chrysophthalmus]|nr:MAG: hypothetical protein LQ350_004863 [Niorma chrysophthalma]